MSCWVWLSNNFIFLLFNYFCLILARSLKQPSVTDASRVCCWNSLLRSSSRSGSPPQPLPLLLLPPQSWYQWTTRNYGPWSGLRPEPSGPESREKQKTKPTTKELRASRPRFRALLLLRTLPSPLWRRPPPCSWRGPRHQGAGLRRRRAAKANRPMWTWR